MSDNVLYLIIFFVGMISPSYWLTRYLSGHVTNTKVIRINHWIYLTLSLFTLFVFILLNAFDVPHAGDDVYYFIGPYILCFWNILLLSRCSEIFYMFFLSGYEDLSHKNVKHLSFNLLFRSYLEIFINFALMYLLFPIYFWKNENGPQNIIDALHFSGLVITTLGYADAIPDYWLLQCLSIFEGHAVYILLLITFTIYVSTNDNGTKD